MKQYITLGNTTYFWFGSNDTSGSGGDGATPLCDVRLAGAAVDAIPVYSPTPALLSHANYPAGCYEVAIAATAGNGFAAGNTYAVFCSLTIDSQNPTGFVGSFDLKPVESNPIQLGSSAQSATDLKDLADTGYNPTTHKLAGVVLADTCTTNTDMRGTNSAITSLAAITDDKDSYKATGYAPANEYDTEMAHLDVNVSTRSSHADPSSGIESHGDTHWPTATGFATQNPPSQSLADYRATGFSTHGDPTSAIETYGDTKWTTATGFNTVVPDAAGVAPTTTEIKDALEINGSKLDHIWETTEDDAGVRRFTANALEEAPSGTGGDATAASQTAIIGHLTGMKGGTWLETTDSLEAIRDRGDTAWLTGAGGSSPTVEQIRIEMDTNSTKMAPSQTLGDYKATGFSTHADPSAGIESHGDLNWTTATGFNIVVPDAAGVAPTVVEIRTEMDTNSTKMAPSQTLGDYKATGFSTHADPTAGIESHGDSNWTTATGFNTTTPPTVIQIRTEMDTNSTKMAPSQVLGDYKATGFSTHTADNVKTAIEAAGTKLTLALEDTAELQTNQGNWTTATGFATPTNITAGIITTTTNLTNAPTIGDLTTTMKASINTEVVDVIKVDTVAEMAQGILPVAPTIEGILNTLYRKLRNKSETTENEDSVYNDAGTIKLIKATLSDNGTTFTKGEYGSGA